MKTMKFRFSVPALVVLLCAAALTPDGLAQTAGTREAMPDRTSLPIAEPKIPHSTILDARDATPPPRFLIKAPDGAPNVLIVLVDDMGFGMPSAFGGPVRMPAAERLAAQGLRYNQFHTTALCSPTRMALLTGRNHHMGNMGSITETATAFPGNTGQRPDNDAMLAELNFIDDKEGKPVGIQQHIGRRPIMAFGNSDGDFQMLEWTTSGSGARFGLIVHHTDAAREFAYDRDSSVGRLARGLDEATSRGWTVVDMQTDWKQVYP